MEQPMTEQTQGSDGLSHPATEHHREAARHYQEAAKHHEAAASHHAVGEPEKAAEAAHHAHGHAALATHHAGEAAKFHATHDTTKKQLIGTIQFD